jgi:hypothetical protein
MWIDMAKLIGVILDFSLHMHQEMQRVLDKNYSCIKLKLPLYNNSKSEEKS